MSPHALFDHAIILTGPTGSGKSSLAWKLAKEFHGEIISMDSMTVYRQMDIGTAKLTALERADVPHHLVDCMDPWDGASVAWWLESATAAVHDILQRHRWPIIVGGTPLYLKSIVHGLFAGPDIDPELRREIEACPAAELHQQLLSMDPRAATRIHPNDHKRLVRAVEVYRQTGIPLSDLQQQFDSVPPARSLPIICLDLPRAVLYERINKRVDEMMQAGWLDEVKHLLTLQKPLSKEAAQAAGYRELIAHLQGHCTLETAIDATKTRTRQLAKRQLTWFRHFPGLEMLTPDVAEQRLRTYMSSITPAIGSASSPL